MLLHLVSAVIAILQFSSVSGDSLLGQSTPVYPPLYIQCKGGPLFGSCADAIGSVWNNLSLPDFNSQHQYTNWIKGCKLTWWAQNDGGVTFKSMDKIDNALISVQDKCPNAGPVKASESVKGYRNVFVGKLEGEVEVVIMLDGQ